MLPPGTHLPYTIAGFRLIATKFDCIDSSRESRTNEGCAQCSEGFFRPAVDKIGIHRRQKEITDISRPRLALPYILVSRTFQQTFQAETLRYAVYLSMESLRNKHSCVAASSEDKRKTRLLIKINSIQPHTAVFVHGIRARTLHREPALAEVVSAASTCTEGKEREDPIPTV